MERSRLLLRVLGRDQTSGQAVRFVIVGVINTVVDMGAFYLLGLIPGMSLVAAKAISYNLGTANSFVLNKYWTFSAGKSKRGLREFGIFFAVNVPPLVVDVFVFTMLGLWAGSGSFWARMAKAFAAAVVTTAWSFVGSRYLAFRTTALEGSTGHPLRLVPPGEEVGVAHGGLTDVPFGHSQGIPSPSSSSVPTATT